MGKQRTPRPAEESFVIRIGSDDPAGLPERWRATIVHVSTGERRYVTSYADVCAFIDARRPRTPAGRRDPTARG